MSNVATNAVHSSPSGGGALRGIGQLVLVLVLTWAVGMTADRFLSAGESAHSSAEGDASLAAQLTSRVVSASPELAQHIRYLAVSEPKLRFAAVWHDGERLYPEQGALLTLAESRGLQQLRGSFAHLRSVLAGSGAERSATVHVDGQAALARCWRPEHPAGSWDICAVFASASPVGSSDTSGLGGWIKVGLGLLMPLLLLSAVLFYLARRLREWVHDARQPLCNMRLHLDLLTRLPSRAAECREVLDAEVTRLDGALQRLARWQSLRSWWAGRKSAQTHDLQSLLNSMARGHQSALAAANCSLYLDVGRCPSREVEAQGLQRIVCNALDNCARHAPGSAVSLVCRAPLAPGDWLLIEVLCIAAAKGQQAVSTTGHHGVSDNAGMGLRSCRSLAKARGWRLQVKNDLQSFVVSLSLPPGAPSMSHQGRGLMSCYKS